MNSSVVLGIAGTAKNTGKTTALNALLEEAHARHVPTAVTSIGYDGESVDNVTGLPKPRIVLHPGTIATTSRVCLPPSGWEVIETTEWTTALGQIVIVRCLEAGPIVLAGPSTRRELIAVVERMRGLGPSITLLDGALNRLAPMSIASALVLATGAARSDDRHALARETAAIESLFALPECPYLKEAVRIEVTIPFASIADVSRAIAGTRADPLELVFPVPISPSVLRALPTLVSLQRRVQHVVFRDPIVALLSGDPLDLRAAIDSCRTDGMTVSVDRALPLAVVTLNPVFPRLERHSYVEDRLPAQALRNAMDSALRTPVVDVVLDGREALWNALAFAWSDARGL